MYLRLRRSTGVTATRALALMALALPACVVKFSDRYAPIPNGGVTGPAADCSQVTPLPVDGAPDGAARVRLLGRFADPAPTEIVLACDEKLAPTNTDTRPAQAFEFSGTQIQFRFDGTSASVGIHVPPRPAVKDRVSGQPTFDPTALLLFTLKVDDDEPFNFNVRPCRPAYDIKALYADAGRTLAPGVHTVTLHRNSEALFGPAFFYGVEVEGTLLPPVIRQRRMELIGDSITCGYGILGPTATCPFSPSTQDNYQAYGTLAARMLGAEVTTECWSGKGVYQNYSDAAFPDEPRDTDERKAVKRQREAAAPAELMPLLWTRTLPSRGPLTDPGLPALLPSPDDPNPQPEGATPEVKWDFAKQAQPQAVVINLGTNDFTRDNNFDNVPDGFEEKRYIDAFEIFLRDVRSKYPDAHVFVSMSPMVSDQFPFVGARALMRSSTRAIVDRLNGSGDAKIYFMELVEQGFRYGLGCDYHPNLEVHRVMAEQVAGAIRSKLCW